MGYGAANRVQFHVVTPGSPDTINATPTWACTQIISTQTDGLVSKKQVTFNFEIDEFADTTLTALEALVSSTEPSDTTAEKYENGNESSQGVTSSSAVTRSVMIKYGGDLSATKIHVIVAHGFVTNASWGHTTKWEEVTKPALEFKTQKQATGNSITIGAGAWDGTIVETTSPTPSLPTTLTGGTYGSDYALQKAA